MKNINNNVIKFIQFIIIIGMKIYDRLQRRRRSARTSREMRGIHEGGLGQAEEFARNSGKILQNRNLVSSSSPAPGMDLGIWPPG